MFNLEQYEKDLSVTTEGIGHMSRRALAKMCGFKNNPWRNKGGHFFNSKIDEKLSEYGFESGHQIFNENGKVIDIVCSIVIKYYAYAGKEIAQQWDMYFSATGMRQAIRDAKGWKQTRTKKLTPEEIIELCVLPVPTLWQRRFPIEYYSQLERLTNLKAEGHKRPALWAKLTKELVYDYLPTGVYNAVKNCKEKTGSWDKLHQFLSDEGVMLLEKHQKALLTYMEASSSLDDLNRMLNQAKTKQYQLLLF
ncbi:P63C domain-containing protein [Crocosphaera sp.]|uniref:P63C domain-containing protein n=1 Tax=Crocosphaera sp. TaxID=2729996 RepID=UPI00260C203B|nr:P63C domain-containing protein [Crocosphaera sp.]MDJ0579071.1 P63C domain-containing protein [Crocosphaera sp.]